MKKTRLPLVAFVFSLILSTVAHAEVWTATQFWSPQMEQRYQDWVRTHWNKNIFVDAGPLQNVKLDCADAVISMRMLFAYENKLPFGIKDPSSNRTITNDMNRYNSTEAGDKRFRAFANYLYDILDTPELPMNSYPVAMNRDAIHAGVFLRTDKNSHHSWTVQNLDRAGIPYLLFASRPARTQLLDRHYYPTMGFLWGAQDSSGSQIDSLLQTPGDVASGVGFRMYRYTEDLLKPVWQVAGYSTEQYSMNKINWARTLQRALQITAETPDEVATRLLGEVCKEATDRVVYVNLAIKAMVAKGSACFDAAEYDDLSTPSKDSRAVGVFNDLVRAYRANSGSYSSATRAKVEAVVNNRDPGTYCSVRIGSGNRMTLGEVVNLALAGRWSSNPNDSLLARWGRERAPSSHAASCPVY